MTSFYLPVVALSCEVVASFSDNCDMASDFQLNFFKAVCRKIIAILTFYFNYHSRSRYVAMNSRNDISTVSVVTVVSICLNCCIF